MVQNRRGHSPPGDYFPRRMAPRPRPLLRRYGPGRALLKQSVLPRLACSPLGAARASFLPIFFQGYNQDAVRREIVPENLRWNRRKSSPMTQTDVSATTPVNHLTDEDLSAGIPATPLAALLAQ